MAEEKSPPAGRYLDRIGISICGLPLSPRGSRVREVGERAPAKADERVD
jgi:hypothetical protein